MKPKPLKSKTMTLKQLQKATLKLIRQVRKHLHREAWQPGLSDNEFDSTVLYELEARIKQDQEIMK